MATVPTSVVIPTLGRPSLRRLLDALAAASGPRPEAVIVVDDRAGGDPLDTSATGDNWPDLHVCRSGGRGPAAARNVGWRHSRTPWVSFLDDDVVPDPDWLAALAADLDSAEEDVAGIAGRVTVPLPADRRPTDWERTTAGLETASWITADLTYRRSALADVGGFDERFPRAYREDADLGLRVSRSCGRIITGNRTITHPVRPADDWVSVRQQAGNADDVLMRRLHGKTWRDAANAPRGRRSRHIGIVICAVAAAGLLPRSRRAAALPAFGYVLGVAEFAASRLAPGPRNLAEVRRIVLTSALIPFAAVWYTAGGLWRHRRAAPWRGVPELVLFDRDGTLVRNVPYNGDPAEVEPLPGVRQALDRLRAAGVRTGVVTNQSGVASGAVTAAQVDAVNRQIEKLLGPFDVWQVCPHGPDEGCGCRKPAPGMVKAACLEVDVHPGRCVVIGDIGSDMEAAYSAGAAGILVPTAETRQEEVVAAGTVVGNLPAAVELLLAGDW